MAISRPDNNGNEEMHVYYININVTHSTNMEKRCQMIKKKNLGRKTERSTWPTLACRLYILTSFCSEN